MEVRKVTTGAPNWRGSPVVPASAANAPPVTGQTYVTGLPVSQLPIRPHSGPEPGQGTGVPGNPVARASGNPAVYTDPNIPPPKRPYGMPRVLGVAQETSWRAGWQFANDKQTINDRHVISKVGHELSGRDSGNTDPPKDGPARPSWQTINRSFNYTYGTDYTINLDDPTRPYARNSQGMYIGEQGSGWNQINGGTPGLWQPYGSYAGITAGPVKGIQSPVAQGAPGDGRQSFFAGPPHGMHSPTMPDYVATLGYYMAVPQMRAPRIDRPSNSTQAGQSYSMVVQPQGQTGTIAQQVNSPGAGVNWQTRRVSGWRGQAGAGNAG